MPIVIEGRRNLELFKKMALSHMTICARKALRSNNVEDHDRFEKEMNDAEQMANYADAQLLREKSNEE